ncbi:MAG: hypothetical protein KME07_20835 [Pegethrix bostrychoides GSE-TBD4-15B]|uniref:Uncharacterized protein n=1 Tax=Pegethrix bostrychoides GSE-TBD4-15B TaxID=2839662 RepID=A0A951U6P8_9CYAN|nr:hypothetical protein [Pegethrix bostrychoides GSE-TBD4-15B]
MNPKPLRTARAAWRKVLESVWVSGAERSDGRTRHRPAPPTRATDPRHKKASRLSD